MPPIRTNEIIDLCSSSPASSPSPIRVRTRSQSRTRSPGPRESAESSQTRDLNASDSGKNATARSNTRGRKGKGKQPMRSLGPVIELTDSEDESEKEIPLASTSTGKNRPSFSRVASSSGNTSGSSSNHEKAMRNVIPDINGDPSRFSVPNPGKDKGKEMQMGEDPGSDLLEHVVPKDDADKPPSMTIAKGPEAPIVGPSNQPATVSAQAPTLPASVPLVPPDPEPVPGPVEDPPTQALARILEVVPNVDPEFLYPLIATHLPNFGDDPIRAAEYILGAIFEMGDKVPKVNVKGKRKSVGGEDGGGRQGEGKEPDGDDDGRHGKKAKVDWASHDRPFQGTAKYLDLALIHLQTSFPHIPKRYVRRQLMLHNCHYAPTHLALLAQENAERKGYDRKVTRYNPEKDRARLAAWKDPVLEEERAWILERENEAEEERKQDKGKGKAKADDDGDDVNDGEGIECQCCFCEYPFDNMVQCPEAHLFCTTCVSQYAATQLGSHCATLLCMHRSECKQPFPESELRRVLDSKLMDLYDRVKQRKEIEDAGLEDLEECPFCEWRCVIESSKEVEKLFRCGNEEGGCGVVSCRMCKKEDHLPKSCKEVEEDGHLDNQHAVEEAMTQALMRQCPKCKKPFVKDAGCNKMSCPNCRTLSCYICRQIIKGYDHFDQNPSSAPSGSRKSGKCLLWDSVEQRHADEVKAAAERALAEFQKSNPDADASAIKVDIPKAPTGQGGTHYHGGVFNHNANDHNHFNIAAMNAHAHQAGIQQMPQAQLGGIWGAGMQMPAGVVRPMIPPPPMPAVLPPAHRAVPMRGAALIAHARRVGANRRRGADPDGPRVAHHAPVRAEPAPIPHPRLGEVHAPLGPAVPHAPALQNAHPQFLFGLAGLGGRIAPQQQPLYEVNAAQQRLREALDVNERLMARQRLINALDGRQNELRVGVVGDAGARANNAHVNPAAVDDEQLEQRLIAARQKVMHERTTLMQEHRQHMLARMNAAEPLRMYHAEPHGGVGVGGRPLPAMGYHAAPGMPIVPQNFGGPQHRARK